MSNAETDYIRFDDHKNVKASVSNGYMCIYIHTFIIFTITVYTYINKCVYT